MQKYIVLVCLAITFSFTGCGFSQTTVQTPINQTQTQKIERDIEEKVVAAEAVFTAYASAPAQIEEIAEKPRKTGKRISIETSEFFYGLWQKLGKDSELKDYDSSSYDPKRFVEIDEEGFYTEYIGEDREVEFISGEWEFSERSFIMRASIEDPDGSSESYMPQKQDNLLFLADDSGAETYVWKRVE